MTPASRMGRLWKRGLDADDEDLSEDEHAWWAAREEVQAVPRGRVEDDEPEPDPGFSDYWTAESLFEDPPPGVGAAPPGAEHGDDLPDGHMDLDAAHLVLQIQIGDDWEVITGAHRRLAKLFHPDRLVDLSPEAQELGRLRMAEINAAHATLRALHFRN